MTTNLHDKMLAAIDAYFSASNEIEAHIAEEQLLDVRAEINKQRYVPETNFGNMAEPKIGCVNHDCAQCKSAPKPWVGLTDEEKASLANSVDYEEYYLLVENVEAKLMEKNT
jgi:hypothetical protein